jgi:hypothetical protein
MGGIWYRRDGCRLVIPSSHPGGAINKGWEPSTGKLDPSLTGIDRSKLQDEYLPYLGQIVPGLFDPSATIPDGKRLAQG